MKIELTGTRKEIDQQKEDITNAFEAKRITDFTFVENVMPDELWVVVNGAEYGNWYRNGQVYKVTGVLEDDDSAVEWYPLVNDRFCGVEKRHCVVISDQTAIDALEETDIKGRQ